MLWPWQQPFASGCPVTCWPSEGAAGYRPELSKEAFPFCHPLQEGKVLLYWNHDYKGESSSSRPSASPLLLLLPRRQPASLRGACCCCCSQAMALRLPPAT